MVGISIALSMNGLEARCLCRDRSRAPSPYNPIPLGDWCIGNTVVSKTATRGSTPRSPAFEKPRLSGAFRFVEPIVG